jgi:hypothetical protein
MDGQNEGSVHAAAAQRPMQTGFRWQALVLRNAHPVTGLPIF